MHFRFFKRTKYINKADRHKPRLRAISDQPTDRRTDRQTEGRTDQKTADPVEKEEEEEQ